MLDSDSVASWEVSWPTSSPYSARVVPATGVTADERNRASLAHPNPVLPGPEANLVINAVRTIFHYLDHKLRA